MTPAAALSDITMMSAADLSVAIQTKRVSCREVMTATLDRIERVNPKVNAIVSLVERPELLAAADTADAEIARGHRRGWMHGFPHAVKDLLATKGIPTTLGSPLFADWIPDADDIAVERLRASGAIIIGKTNTPEFGLGSQTYNRVFGTTRNAYDQTRTSGGSSGGAAVGVALRMLPVADGGDTGGSLRNPSGWNGIVGFRPSAGRVPLGPDREAFLDQLHTLGPMGRDVRDVALLLAVMAGRDARVPLSLDGPGSVFAAPLERDVSGARIGWLGDLGGLPMEAGMLDLCLTGLRRLEDAGCVIEEARLGVDRETLWSSFVVPRQVVFAGKYARFHRDPASRMMLKPEAIWEIEGGLGRSALDLHAAETTRTAVYHAFRVLFERFDMLALPAAQVFPFDAATPWPAAIEGVAMDSYHRWMEVAAPATLAGLPAISVPAGFNADGLPTGLQIIGPARQDFAVLQVAYAYEQVSKAALSRAPPL